MQGGCEGQVCRGGGQAGGTAAGEGVMVMRDEGRIKAMNCVETIYNIEMRIEDG